jgi:hypothetical protein
MGCSMSNVIKVGFRQKDQSTEAFSGNEQLSSVVSKAGFFFYVYCCYSAVHEVRDVTQETSKNVEHSTVL